MRSAVELEPTDNCRFAAGSSRTLLPHSPLKTVAALARVWE